ncbi:MAG: hypothetical protein ACPGJV_07540 [Bacteriovoracaceae bacterium]
MKLRSFQIFRHIITSSLIYSMILISIPVEVMAQTANSSVKAEVDSKEITNAKINFAKNVSIHTNQDTTRSTLQHQQCTPAWAKYTGTDAAMAQINDKITADDRFGECLNNQAILLSQNDYSNISDAAAYVGQVTDNVRNLDAEQQALAKKEEELNKIEREIATLKRQNNACAPTTASNPEYCNSISQDAPDGCDELTFKKIEDLQRKRDSVQLEVANIQQRIQGTRDINAGAQRGTDQMWFDYATHAQRAVSLDKQIDEAEVVLAERKRDFDEANAQCPLYRGFGYATCNDRDKERLTRAAYNAYRAAQNHLKGLRRQLRAQGNQLKGQVSPQQGLSSANGQGKTINTNLVNQINQTTQDYDEMLGQIHEQNQSTNEVYDQALNDLREAKLHVETTRDFQGEYKIFDLATFNLSDDSRVNDLSTGRARALLNSDLALLGTSMAAISNLNCYEIGWINNRIQKRSCDYDKASINTNGPMSNQQNVAFDGDAQVDGFKDNCYVRSYNLFRAASANYMAAEINSNSAAEDSTVQCIMHCEPVANIPQLKKDFPARFGHLDPDREPNCDANGQPGFYKNDENPNDVNDEQFQSLLRAANLYGTLVDFAELKAATKKSALDMFRVAYQAALEEMSAKTQRVAMAQANLDAAKARKANAQMNIMILIITIATATAIGSAAAASQNYGLANAMFSLAAAAAVVLLFFQQQLGQANQQIAKWEDQLKDAQLHGAMACNWPGIDSTYTVLNTTVRPSPTLIRGAGYVNLASDQSGDQYLGLNGQDIQETNGGNIQLPSNLDPENLQHDTQFSEEQLKDACRSLSPSERPIECSQTVSIEPFTSNKPKQEYVTNEISEQESFVNRVSLWLKENNRVSFQDIIKAALISEAHAQQTANQAGFDSAEITNSDKSYLKTVGVRNESADFLYYLALKTEAWKLQSQNNVFNQPRIDLTRVPVDIDQLQPVGTDHNTAIAGYLMPFDTDANGINEHDGFLRYNFTDLRTASYRHSLPEKSGFPLPETRHVYIFSVIEMLMENLRLHNANLGLPCVNNPNDTSTADGELTTVCQMANRYANLIRYSRQRMNLGTVGLENDFSNFPDIPVGVCMKSNSSGGITFDEKCLCKQNGSCYKYKSPKFGKYSDTLAQTGEIVIKGANDTLSGNLTAANIEAGKLANKSSAIKKALRREKNVTDAFSKVTSKKPRQASKKSSSTQFFDPFSGKELGAKNTLSKESRFAAPQVQEQKEDLLEKEVKLEDQTVEYETKKGHKTEEQKDEKTKPNGPRQLGYYEGKGDFDMNFDDEELDPDKMKFKNRSGFDLGGIDTQQLEEKEKIKRSFASYNDSFKQESYRNRYKDAYNDVHDNRSLSLFKIISKRYKRSGIPLIKGQKTLPRQGQ